MTRLPGATHVLIADAKLRDYLLNPFNIQNRGKAAFFEAFGFTRSRWKTLGLALRRHPVGERDFVTARDEVRRQMQPGDPGRSQSICGVVWIIDAGGDNPRLVTTYGDK